eukprot:403345995
MGNVCDLHQLPDRTQHLHLKPKKNKGQYSVGATLIRDADSVEISVSFWDQLFIFGKKNNGWACHGNQMLPNGCEGGYAEEFNSFDVQAYICQADDIIICTNCFKRIEEQKELPKWFGYYIKKKETIELQFSSLVIIRNQIRARGMDKLGGEFSLSGSFTYTSGDLLMKMKYQNLYMLDVVAKINQDAKIIKGSWFIGKQSDVLKISLMETRVKPWNFIKKMEPTIKVGNHQCRLKGPSITKTGWACDGRTIFAFKCLGGITDFNKTEKTPKYDCRECDFDLCDTCTKYSLWADQFLAKNKQVWSGTLQKDLSAHQHFFNNKDVAGKERNESSQLEQIDQIILTNIVFIDKIIYGFGADKLNSIIRQVNGNDEDFVINGRLKKSTKEVSFIKYYLKSKEILNFTGKINEEGNNIEGQWSNSKTKINGRFEINLIEK